MPPPPPPPPPPPGKHSFDTFITPAAEGLRRSGTHVLLRLRSRHPLPNRTSLLFKHFPKAAGSFAKGALADCVRPQPLHLLREEQPLLEGHRQRHFVVGSVREPCAAYVSLWAYGRAARDTSFFHKKLRQRRGTRETCALYANCAKPSSNSTSVAAFRRWLRDPDVAGVISARFVSLYGTEPHVDCWVGPEPTPGLAASMTSCLRRFEAQGGHVAWRADQCQRRLALAADGSASTAARAGSSSAARARGPGRRLAPAGRVNSSPHLACGAYFDARARTFVARGLDRTLLHAGGGERGIGFGGCCGGRCELCGAGSR